MDDFDEINEFLSEKFDYIKHNISQIIFGESDRLFYTSGIYSKDLKDAIDNGNQKNMPERTQIAFSYLLDQAKEFDFSRTLDFIVFETLFYTLITDAYMYQRHSAQSDDLISIELAKEIFEKKQYDYLSLIYEIIQLEFWWWLKYRDNFNCSDFPNNTNAARAGIHLTRIEKHIGTKEYWCKIKELASEAHTLFPEGELANRIMLISDVQLIYSVGKWKDVYDPANEELVKYRNIRDNFIMDCFSDDFEDYGSPLGWITGLPHFAERNTSHLAASKCRNEEERKSFLDDCYQDIMLFPASIYIPNSTELVLSGLVGISKDSSLEQAAIADAANKAIISENNRLKEEKKSIINGFSHTYKNMRATSLLEVANALLATGDEELMRHGRTVLLEYDTKQTLTKEVELLQLRFEDETDKLQNKIRESMYYEKSPNNSVTIRHLLGEAFKRCLITLFLDIEDQGPYMRKGFRSDANFTKKLGPFIEKFEKQILFKQDGDVFDWFSSNMIPIHSNFSPAWTAMQFENGNYAAVMITGLLAELTANMFKYADKSKDIFYLFDEKEDRLIISIRNTAANRIEHSSGSGKGLTSYSEIFRLLNKAGNINDDAIKSVRTQDDGFETTVILSKAIFE